GAIVKISHYSNFLGVFCSHVGTASTIRCRTLMSASVFSRQSVALKLSAEVYGQDPIDSFRSRSWRGYRNLHPMPNPSLLI
ncbi:hypothetical protein MUP77_03230, partial [Candidatus Bathyarchaeota archaeon]|nr:hypothetical protein [Candidatus Bathyarchaeota archaeon]